jgi:hypothetical protein
MIVVVDFRKMDAPTPKGCQGFLGKCHPYGIGHRVKPLNEENFHA